jgi:uncharacterized protein involved in outer membrane biogenesis
MSTGKKIALGIVIFFALLLVGLAIVVRLLLDVDRYRAQVVALLRDETGKPAQIGRLALTLFPTLALRVDDFALGNPAGFPEGNFLKVHRIRAELDVGALWDRQILIKSLQLDQPLLNLLSDPRGRWNFENAPKPRSLKTASEQDKPLFSLDVISRVYIEGAQLTAANVLPSGRPGPAFFAARGLSGQLQHVDLNALAGSSSAAPAPETIHSSQVALTGWLTSIGYAAAPRPTPAAEGPLKAESLNFGTLQLTEVKTRLRLFPRQVYFDDLSFSLYGGRATGALAVDLAGANPRYNAHAQLGGVDVARLLAAFPGARGKMTGKMDGNLKLSGEVTHSPDPLAGMQGAGQVNVLNGQLPSLQLNRNLMLLARLSNLGPASGDPSSFSSLSADLNIANDRISSNKIRLVGNGVDVDGSGSVALAGAGSLDYQGVAKIVAGQSAISNLLQGLVGATAEGGKLSFPFNIAGTLASPRFLLRSTGRASQLGALQNPPSGKAGQQATTQPGQTPQQPADLLQGLEGLFKKKKQAQPQQPSPQPQ